MEEKSADKKSHSVIRIEGVRVEGEGERMTVKFRERESKCEKTFSERKGEREREERKEKV